MLSSSEKFQRISFVLGVIGAVGALLQLAGYSFAFLISSALEHDPYYNPFDFQALFLLAGLVIATVLGLAGGVISRKSSRAGGRVLFAATGVTFGDFLKGVRFMRGGATTQSVVMRSSTMTVRIIDAEHHFDRKPNYGD